MVPDEEDGPNLQGPSGHFSERTWKTVSAQEMETSWYSMVEDTLLSPKSPTARGSTLSSSHMVHYPVALTEALGFLVPRSSPVPGGSRSCALDAIGCTELCYNQATLGLSFTGEPVQGTPRRGTRALRSLLGNGCILARRKVHTGD